MSVLHIRLWTSPGHILDIGHSLRICGVNGCWFSDPTFMWFEGRFDNLLQPSCLQVKFSWPPICVKYSWIRAIPNYWYRICGYFQATIADRAEWSCRGHSSLQILKYSLSGHLQKRSSGPISKSIRIKAEIPTGLPPRSKWLPELHWFCRFVYDIFHF